MDPTASLVEDVIIAGPGNGLSPATLYLDTSVVGGCYDLEFRAATLPLLDRIRNGDATLVTSEILFDELKPAPDRVRAILHSIPERYRHHWHTTGLTETLAGAYLAEGILEPTSGPDAVHVACATLAGADALLSWNFRHMVHPERIRRFREVNRRFGQDYFEISSPKEVLYVD